MHQQTKAISFGLAAVLCWSTVATAFKIALSLQSITQLILIGCITTVVLLSALLATQNRLTETMQYLKTDWPKALLYGTLNPILYYAILLSAYELLPAQIAQPINYTWAIVLALMAVPFLGQTLHKSDLIALVICYTGVVIMSAGAGAQNQSATLHGIALALLSTVVWASYWILNSRDQRPPTVALLQNFLCALPIAAALAWKFGGTAGWSVNGILAGAYIGIFEMGLAFVFWLQAMKLTNNTSRISNLIFISPFLSLVLIYFVLGETIHCFTYVGLGFILLGIFIQNRGAKGQPPNTQKL